MKISRPIVAILATVTLAMAGAVFVPKTTEAHCGEHANTCPATWTYTHTTCEGGYIWEHSSLLEGFCVQPAPGSSGRQAPCMDQDCRWEPGLCASYDTRSEVVGMTDCWN